MMSRKDIVKDITNRAFQLVNDADLGRDSNDYDKRLEPEEVRDLIMLSMAWSLLAIAENTKESDEG
jgi:hypothetical protein